MSDIAFKDKEEISKLNEEIYQSDLWLTYMNTPLLGVVPMMYSDWSTQNDYFMIYNADLKTYNTLPKSSGTYRSVFIAYNSQ